MHTGLALCPGAGVLGEGLGTGSEVGEADGRGGEDDGPGCPAAGLRAGWGCGGDGDCSATRCAPLPGWGVRLTAARGRGLRDPVDEAAGLLLADDVPVAPGGSPGPVPGLLRTRPSTAMPAAMTAASAPDIEALCTHGLMLYLSLSARR